MMKSQKVVGIHLHGILETQEDSVIVKLFFFTYTLVYCCLLVLFSLDFFFKDLFILLID